MQSSGSLTLLLNSIEASTFLHVAGSPRRLASLPLATNFARLLFRIDSIIYYVDFATGRISIF
jgi:hypothetical protein